MVLCTISKGRSLKSCAALVVFCFSLLLACISPVHAVTYSDSDPAFLLYCSVGPDPVSFSFPAPVPCFSNSSFFNVESYGTAVSFNFASSHFDPITNPSTLYAVVGVTSKTSVITSNQSSIWNTEFVVQQSAKGTDRFEGFRAWYRGQAQSSSNSVFLGLEIPINVNAAVIKFDTSEWSITVANGASFSAFLDCAYLIYSQSNDVVSAVIDILAQVRQINGNTSSALSALNEILSQCQSIKADTSTIISVLNVVKSQLITLNGKVDDIYTLLKDSLATESGVVDKKSEELAGQIMQRVDSEQYWSDKNSETFNSLDIGNFTFGDGVVGALPIVGNLFKGLWDSFGDSTLIFTFPLMLGVALVIVGRISRTSGKGSKKGGDDG